MNLKDNSNLKPMELPYEKCINNGAKSLTNTELLAVLLRCGTKEENVLELADRIINTFGQKYFFHSMCNKSYEELLSIKGIGKVKAIQFLCIAEMAKRIATEPYNNEIQLSSPDIIAGMYMQEMRMYETEHVYLLLLDNQNRLVKKIHLSCGSISASILEPREVFIHALRHNAVNIVLLHNHPSGITKPSMADINITKKIYDAGLLIGINLLDHIIIGDNIFTSLKQKGII